MRWKMTCRDGVKLLMDYTEGVLAASQRLAIEGHVHGCPRCRRFVHWYNETPVIVRAATVATMPARLGGRLRRALATARDRGYRRANRE